MLLKKNPKLKKYIRTTALAITVLLALGIASLFVFGKYFEKQVKQIIVSEINKQITSEVKVESIELTLIRRFPYASLYFRNVQIMDRDTVNPGILLEAQSIFLKFSIIDLLQGRYNLKRIEIDDGKASLRDFKDETDNYSIFRSGADSTASSFDIRLEKVVLQNTEIRYTNFASGISLAVLAESARISGNISEAKYKLGVEGDFFIHSLVSEEQSLIKDKKCSASFRLKVDNDKDLYSFTRGELLLDRHEFEVSGTIEYPDKYALLDLSIKGKNLNVNQLLRELPADYTTKLNDYRLGARLYFESRISGKMGGPFLPSITALMNISDGSMSHSKTKAELKNIAFRASFSNGAGHKPADSRLLIENFSGLFAGKEFNGKLSILNFSHPYIELILSAHLDLAEAGRFLQNEKIEQLKGQGQLDFSYKGQLNDDWSFSLPRFTASTTSGVLAISGGALQYKDDPVYWSNINGTFRFNNNDILIDSLSLLIQQQHINLSGYFRNMIPWLMNSKNQLELNASLSSPNLKIDELLFSNKKTDAPAVIEIPPNIKADLVCEVRKLGFGNFECKDLSTKIRLRNRQILFSYLNFQSMEGSVESRGMIDGSVPARLLISGEAKLKSLNVQHMFYQMNNFGQKSMTHKNISGLLEGNLQFAGIWKNDLTPDLPSMYAVADIRIDKGRLINYEPMQALSRFIKVEELADIQFASLKNCIEIKNRLISIPQMEINSSALNLKASGTHDFDNNINYHLQVLLSDLLSKKAKTKKENLEFGDISDDGDGKISLFLLITGNMEDPKFRYDRAGVKQKLKQDIKQEKQQLKEMLNKEFGWFHSDTTLSNRRMRESTRKRLEEKKEIKEQEKGKFILEWEE